MLSSPSFNHYVKASQFTSEGGQALALGIRLVAAEPRGELLPKHLSGVLVKERPSRSPGSGSTSGNAKPAL
jgi:hypothetical protein